MDCKTARRLIEADLDGEIELVHHLELERHVRVCAECARSREGLQERKTALRDRLPRFAAPAGLAGRVRAALADIASGATLGETKPQFWPEFPGGPRVTKALKASATPLPNIWKAVGLAASIGVALLAGYRWGGARARNGWLVEEAVAEHIRSLQVGHLSDVTSTDRHTVKPWFAGKLEFAPPVIDLAAAGFPLTGGRLDHIAGQPAAALVFHRRAHALNLFIWPANGRSVPAETAAREGYHTQSWSQGGFNFLAISEVPADEVATFAAAFQAGVAK